MDPDPWLIPLAEAADLEAGRIGGKAQRLAELARAGFRTPAGFCVTTDPYRAFVAQNRLAPIIQMELGRKPMDAMRWEEIWDAALRIRSAFLAAPLPTRLEAEVSRALDTQPADLCWAVRSSAPGEDAEGASFAGLHESRVDLVGVAAVLDAVRVVWASLWSDAALLYRRELALDPARSAMAVLLQPMVRADRSGVAFGRDPRAPEQDRAIVEVVPGPCGDLVDGSVDPDRFSLARPGGSVLEWRPGDRGDAGPPEPLLDADDLVTVMRALLEVEALCGWPPDLEWTGRAESLALLQARPITSGRAAPADAGAEDKRPWYLSLRPDGPRLARLCDQVERVRIPELEEDIARLSGSDLERLDDRELAAALDERSAALEHWRKIYWDEFIPLAHGVRHLGAYYDEAVRPRDPYEFVGLLNHAPLAANLRNERIRELAARVRASSELRRDLDQTLTGEPGLDRRPEGRAFLEECRALLSGVMDVCFDGERLADREDLLLSIVRSLANRPADPADRSDDEAAARALERRLLDAVGPGREDEAHEVLRIGRVSWRLRDDDNLLLGRIESQLLGAVGIGLGRLRRADRVEGDAAPAAKHAHVVARALREPGRERLVLEKTLQRDAEPRSGNAFPRQLVGQPAGPGFATGRARRIRGVADLGRFENGEVLVCDSIQPTMTHLVPLASAIVERRGGMLIHGAIIARELGIPCVNGVAAAVEQVRDGDWLSVDGDTGLVTVGPPEFDLERER